MHILSYDIASKSLALSIIKFNTNWKSDLSDIQKSFNDYDSDISGIEFARHALNHINKIYKLVDEMIVPILFDVVDLIPNQKLKDTTPVIRSARLATYLRMIDTLYLNTNEKYKVLLEFQMGPNDKSRNVCSQILCYYSAFDVGFKTTYTHDLVSFNNQLVDDTEFSERIYNSRDNYDIEIVGPSLKNKINFDKEKNLQFFMNKYAKPYDANKKHSVANFLKWVNAKNIIIMVENIPKKNLDDIADSVNMALAWIFIKSGWLD